MTPLQLGEDVAATMRNLDRALRSSTRDALRDAGKTAKAELERVRPTPGPVAAPAQHARRPSRRQGSGVRRRGGDLAVGSVGHPRTGRAGPHRSARRGNVWRIGGRVVRGPVRHPGTRNTNAWTIGQEATFRAVETDFPKQVGDAVEGAFGG